MHNKHFSKYSGFRLKIGKTFLMWIGPWRIKRTNLNNFKTKTKLFNLLGYHLVRNVEESNKVNSINKVIDFIENKNNNYAYGL